MNCPTCNRNITKRGCWHCGTFHSKAEVQREYYARFISKNDRRPYWKERYRMLKERKAGLATTIPNGVEISGDGQTPIPDDNNRWQKAVRVEDEKVNSNY